jgi:hypothetical protein
MGSAQRRVNLAPNELSAHEKNWKFHSLTVILIGIVNGGETFNLQF